MVYIFLGDGFEEAEAVCPIDILRRCGVDIKTVSVMKDDTVVGSHGIPVVADLNVKDIKDDAQMYILPGGMTGVENLSKSERLCGILKTTGARIAAICAAPTLLASLGLLKGVRAICYPSLTSALGGASVTHQKVVTDGRFTTSMGPGTAFDFGFALAALLCGEDTAEKVKKAMLLDK